MIKSFLTARNDSLNDDKRLAFDRVLFDLDFATQRIAPVGLVGAVLGALGPR